MVSSPRKQSHRDSPRKVSKPTPTKPTRTSPRKKPWGSPQKVVAKPIEEVSPPKDFGELNKKSWAEITEEDEELNALLAADMNSGTNGTVDTRRKGQPKKSSIHQGKPKYVHSQKLTNEVFQSTSSRRLQRSKSRTRKGNSFVETENIQIKSTVSRKRCISNSSTINEEVSPTKRRVETGKTNRKAPRALHTDSSASSTASSPSRNRHHWEQPTLGWCTDETTLKRRSREIERAKEKQVYKKYIQEIPIRDRIKGEHPRTPNKLINYSRRSWDTQIKKWKRSLYVFCGEDPSESVNTSFCSYTESDMSEKEEDKEGIRKLLESVEMPVRADVECMASLLGRFDVDSQMGLDESTLKASSSTDPSAPTDFSQMMPPQ